MEKNIREYLHLYLGCECQLNDGRAGRLRAVAETNCIVKTIERFAVKLNKSKVKPILRPLSDMTEEEENEIIYIQSHANYKDYEMAEHIKYLLSKHFDLFGLIESGLAIDKIKSLTHDTA